MIERENQPAGALLAGSLLPFFGSKFVLKTPFLGHFNQCPKRSIEGLKITTVFESEVNANDW